MKSVILAAGYATRLYPLTENFPKPLLKVEGKTILDRLMEDIDNISDIDEHIIVSNHKFIDIFTTWAEQSAYKKPISILDDGSTHNDNRLGAVNDLVFAIKAKNLNDDLLVLAADNIVDFSFSEFVAELKLKNTSMIMCHHEPELKALQRTGVVTFDNNNQVLTMCEKPLSPLSEWAVPPFYIYKTCDIPVILEQAQKGILADAPGNMVIKLLKQTVFHVWKMTGKRMDIGLKELYLEMKNIDN